MSRSLPTEEIYPDLCVHDIYEKGDVLKGSPFMNFSGF